MAERTAYRTYAVPFHFLLVVGFVYRFAPGSSDATQQFEMGPATRDSSGLLVHASLAHRAAAFKGYSFFVRRASAADEIRLVRCLASSGIHPGTLVLIYLRSGGRCVKRTPWNPTEKLLLI